MLLRWGLQRGCVVIPKSSAPERMAENAGCLGFELEPAELAELDALGYGAGDGGRLCWQGDPLRMLDFV